ncbi:MAG TPA: aminopeptidase P family N-terminal domain-containing protein, partial [Stellaceae bacterium]|nr:aminopeptidase P family N-terminal domain-containing protein [Stellaceae bacterium]
MKATREHLARLLKETGSAYDPDGVAGLIAGVLAAPEEIGTSWHRLVADPVPAELAAALEALRRQLVAGHRDGLGPDDFARLPREARVAALRKELTRRGLSGFIVPHADEYQGEYVPLRGQRLAWLTGFTGSAGAAVVLAKRAAMFVDGRYTLQAAAQVDGKLFEIRHLVDDPPPRWLAGALGKGEIVGYDPWLHTPVEVERLREAAVRAGGELRAVDGNPLDHVWQNQPAPPLAPVTPQELRFAGESSEAKRARLAQALASNGIAAAVLTMPESIAWLLNIRGGDVPHTPLPLSYAILRGDASVTLFVDRRKLAPGLDAHLGNAVAIEPPERLGP